MNNVVVKIWASPITLDKIPRYAKAGDAGMDICAAEDVTLFPNSLATPVRTGIHVKIPTGYEIQVRPRSGMSAKTKVRVANSIGTIDSGYIGEIKILLENIGTTAEQVCRGDRIAQLVLNKVPEIVWERVTCIEDLGNTERGINGFGSTGS